MRYVMFWLKIVLLTVGGCVLAVALLLLVAFILAAREHIREAPDYADHLE
jgi:hypothetical protein